jgi:hypothetical protein
LSLFEPGDVAPDAFLRPFEIQIGVVKVGSEYLEVMASSEDPTLARAAGQAVFRALLEAPESGQ